LVAILYLVRAARSVNLAPHGARQQGRPRGSKLDPHRDFLLSRLADEPDMTIQKMQELLSNERGVQASASTIWTFPERAEQTFKKKSAYASEQDRPDVLEKRLAWFEGQLDLDPGKTAVVPTKGIFSWRDL